LNWRSREDCDHAESQYLFSQREFPKRPYLETERRHGGGVWSRLGRSMGGRPGAIAISEGPEESRSQIQKKWSPHNPVDARGLCMGKKLEGGIIIDGQNEPLRKSCSKIIVGTVECDILNAAEGSQAEVAKQNGQVVVIKNYIKNGEEVAAKPNIVHGHVAAAGIHRLQVIRPQSGGGQGMSNKRMRLDVGAAREMNNFASWDGERRAEMIANQRIVGPGVMMDGHYRGEHHTLAEQSGCSNKQRAIPARMPVREQVDRGGKNMLIDVTQNVGPTGRASAGSVLDVGGKKNHGSVAPSTKPAPRWCPPGLSRTQKRRVQRLRTMEMTEKMEEEERDRRFNEDRPMVIPKKTWREKRLAREEKDDDNSSGSDKEESTEAQGDMDINMVFVLPTEFRAGEGDVAELTLGAERAVFEKTSEQGSHLKPLYVCGHIDGKPMGGMLVDGGAGVNVMPLSVFSKLGYKENELIKTNMNLSGFSGEPSQAKGIMSVELTVGSKTVPTAFFVVDVKGRYNVLLGRDWIHANGCVPSTLHQFLVQWVGDQVEVIEADTAMCIALMETPMEWQHSNMRCLTGRDLSGYDFISVERDSFVPIHVKPADIARLNDAAL
jgi:hypothetical protein